MGVILWCVRPGAGIHVMREERQLRMYMLEGS